MAELPQNSFQGPLAPKIGLNDNFQNPIPGGGAKMPKKRNYSALLPVGALALALLILPLTISQMSQQQDTRQRASEPTPTVVIPTSVVNTPTPSPTPTPEQGQASLTPAVSPTIFDTEIK
jgi:hypothetical protein